MTSDFTALTLVLVPLSLLCQWWWLRRRWLTRVQAAQARHARYKARAEVLISIIKQRLAGLQGQVSGTGTVASPKRARPSTLARARGHRSAPRDETLIVVDEDGTSAEVAASFRAAFVDTRAEA